MSSLVAVWPTIDGCPCDDRTRQTDDWRSSFRSRSKRLHL